jgi:type IX secretion system PorP/SprF family membrane protein
MKKIFTILLFLTFAFRGVSQDAHLSMYDVAPMFLNPAMTGLIDGKWRAHIHYRTQWKAVNFKPYQSYLASFDAPLKKKFGVGVQLNYFRAGAGNFGVFNALVSASYNLDLNKKKTHHLSFGVQAGITQKSVEYNLLSFNNQYTLQDGGTFNTALVANENFEQRSVILPALNAGLLYYYSKQNARLNPFVGFSAFNLIAPKETFYGQTNRLPRRYYWHVGTRVNITELIYLIPKVLGMHQGKYFELTGALELGYFLKKSEVHLLAGLIYRSTDAAVITFGLKYKNFILKAAYDINFSSLTKASKGRGGFEIGLTYTHSQSTTKTEKICPRL